MKKRRMNNQKKIKCTNNPVEVIINKSKLLNTPNQNKQKNSNHKTFKKKLFIRIFAKINSIK